MEKKKKRKEYGYLDGNDWAKYQTNEQQDSYEFFMDLVRKMPLNVRALFRQKVKNIPLFKHILYLQFIIVYYLHIS